MVYVADTHFVGGICHAFITKPWKVFAKCHLTELEDYREGVTYRYSPVSLLSRGPFR